MEMEETCILLEEYDSHKIIIHRHSSHNHLGFWFFAKPWLRDWEHDKDTHSLNKLNKLFDVLADWVTKCTLGKEPKDVVSIMGKDKIMRENFSRYYEQYAEFRRNVDTLFSFAPIFDASIIQKAGIDSWGSDEDRQTFVQRVRQQYPAVEKVPDDLSKQHPVCAPPCTFWHFEDIEPIPLDWPHTLSMIVQIRNNLNWQRKTADKSADTRMLAPAYSILLDMWRQELPAPMRSVLPLRLPWLRILVRSGFMAYPIDDLSVSLADEQERNLVYLAKILEKGGFGQLEGKICRFNASEIDQSIWLDTVEQLTLGRKRGPDGGDFDDLEILDTHMAGVVRWLNFVGIRTDFCCDGHSKGEAYVRCPTREDARLAGGLIFLSGLLGKSVRHESDTVTLISASDCELEPRPRRSDDCRSSVVKIRPHVRQLLDVAEWLHDNRERLACIVPLLRQSQPQQPFEPTFK